MHSLLRQVTGISLVHHDLNQPADKHRLMPAGWEMLPNDRPDPGRQLSVGLVWQRPELWRTDKAVEVLVFEEVEEICQSFH